MRELRRKQGNEYDVLVFQNDSAEITIYGDPLQIFPIGLIGVLWYNWFVSQGKKGEEPPAEIKEFYELSQALKTIVNEEKRGVVLDELLQAMAENVWIVGTVGLDPAPGIFNKNLRNVPRSIIHSATYGWMSVANPMVWFYESEK